ncbi:MAG: hypothetical protein WC495_06770 [Patescibacteria group bacterium]
MVWDDLADIAYNLFHIFFDIFYVIEYIFSNLANVFLIIFTPINFAFNFVKGFFDGIAIAPPETAISWTFDSEITDIFSAIPHWDLLMYAVGAGLSVLVLGWVMSHLLKL